MGSEYKDLFMAEANEYLQVLNTCLLKLEEDPENMDSLVEMFRIVHSLKGMAGTMGYDVLTDVSHDLENFMEKVKSGEYPLDDDSVDILFQAVDVFEGLIVDPENPGEQEKEAGKNLLEKISKYKASASGQEVKKTAAEPVKKTPPAADKAVDEGQKQAAAGTLHFELSEMEKELVKGALRRGETAYLVNVALRQGTLMKSVRSYMVVRALEGYGELVTTSPSMHDLDEENFDLTFSIVFVSAAVENKKLHDELIGIAEVESVEVKELPRLQEEPAPAPVSAGAEEDADVVPAGAAAEKKPAKKAEKKKGGAAASVRSTEKTIRVETAKLDELINLIGEMVITRNSIIETGKGLSEVLDRSLGQMERVITELQDAAMKLRMVPIKQVFDRFPRMVRDLSRERGKEVNLKISGEETELDRSIVNQLSDPLVHLLRNAIDHGLENADDRIKLGKKRTGQLQLKAYHEGSHVVILVEDDGRGMDPEKIKNSALKKGVITEEEAAKMSDDEIKELIFHSGFSTAAEVTEVSGRGVGMDAVKKNIELMRGSIEVGSELGRGSRIILRFPLTLAIIKALLVKTGTQIFAIPIENIRENVFLDPQQVKTIQREWVMNLRGEVISLYDLSRLLGFGENDYQKMDEYPVVIVEAGSKKAGMVVEDLIGQQEIVIKSLGGYLKEIDGVAGATVLGDGRVTLIVDVLALIDDRRVEVG